MHRRYALGWLFALLSLSLLIGLAGCGGSSSSSTLPTPTAVTITPNGNSVSVELGTTLQFTGTALNSARQQIGGAPVSYVSSNPSVLTFVPSSAGLACAGSWNATAQVCTGGSIGITQVTAVANGVSSPVVTVYVHDHIDSIQFSEFCPIYPPPPNDTCGKSPPPPGTCVTSALIPGLQLFRDYQAKAFSNNVDITNSVGSFTFSEVSGAVVTLTTNAPELTNNNGSQITEVRATAGKPGITQIYASVGGVNSAPIPFETCLLDNIVLQVGSATTNTTFSIGKGGAGVIVTPTVTDRMGNELTIAQATPLLTWASLSPSNVTVSSSGALTGRAVGGSAIMASCLPPNCNVGSTTGLPPSQQPVYPSNVITGTVTGGTGTGTVYVTSTCNTGSGVIVEGCQPALLPINTSSNIIGSRVVLPSAPNTFLFNPQGNKAFLGSTQGLMVFTPSGGAASTGTSPVTQYNGAPGVVLAVSNDGNSVVVADNVHTPNQVFLVNTTSNANTTTPLLINGATAAAFSPDGYKIFIAATDPTQSPQYHLYVYSSTLALQSIPLSAPVTGISFYANGALAYLNGGAPNAITVYNVCDNSLAETIPVPEQPTEFQAAFDGQHAIGLDSPALQIFNSTLSPPAAPATCPFMLPTPAPTLVNLGQANFTPLKMIITSDSSRAYILAKDRGAVLIYNFGVNTVGAIPLTNSPAPVSATLSSDGSQLYVGGSDGAVHALSTTANVDLTEITFPPNNGNVNNALCTNIPGNCLPDLIAFQP
jgi:hypothetical protein